MRHEELSAVRRDMRNETRMGFSSHEKIGKARKARPCENDEGDL
jgi:hypothetical protein